MNILQWCWFGAIGVGLLYWMIMAILALRAHRSLVVLNRTSPPDPPRWPSLSMIIPACNEEGTLEAAMRSKLAQDCPELELVVVDDRSTDGTGALVYRLGRITLNMLMSFAEFEREMISERTRDKMAAARRRGKWVGGTVPFGYQAVEKKLVVDEAKAPLVREVFALYREYGSALRVAQLFNAREAEARFRSWTQPLVLTVLRNPMYVGLVRCRGEIVPGEQPAIVDRGVFDEVQALLSGRQPKAAWAFGDDAFLLRGLLRCGACGHAMSPVSSVGRRGVRYRYYRCVSQDKRGRSACPSHQLNAAKLEEAFVAQLAEAAPRLAETLTDKTDWLSLTLASFPETWPLLTPRNRVRLVWALVQRVAVDRTRGEMAVEFTERERAATCTVT